MQSDHKDTHGIKILDKGLCAGIQLCFATVALQKWLITLKSFPLVVWKFCCCPGLTWQWPSVNPSFPSHCCGPFRRPATSVHEDSDTGQRQERAQVQSKMRASPAGWTRPPPSSGCPPLSASHPVPSLGKPTAVCCAGVCWPCLVFLSQPTSPPTCLLLMTSHINHLG